VSGARDELDQRRSLDVAGGVSYLEHHRKGVEKTIRRAYGQQFHG
jgi:hypothetical protein